MPRLSLALLLLAVGCHARFKKHASELDAMRVEVITLSGPDVDLGRTGGVGVLAMAYDVSQSIREGSIELAIAQKVDTESVNAAFLRGFTSALGDGPPVAFDPASGHVLQFELVDWGLETFGWGSPGVFNYDLVVHGFRDDNKKIYRARFNCRTTAGAAGWAERSPFIGADHPDKIRNLPDADVQAIFDATASSCGQQVVQKMRYHAG